jgi:hypothetical protein
MGTDIHLYVERQTATGWARVRPLPWTCMRCDGKGEDLKGGECYWCKGELVMATEYHERNYDLFAMLAGVRNRFGFRPLDEPRGKLVDSSIKDTEDIDDSDYDSPAYVWLGDHSFSHATLAELLAYDYSQKTTHRGVVCAAEYVAWVEAGRNGPPTNYSGGVSGRDVRTIAQADMDRLLRTGAIDTTYVSGPFGSFRSKAKDCLSYYTVIEWEESYRDSAGGAWFAFLDACKPLGDPGAVRFVFGFDS